MPRKLQIKNPFKGFLIWFQGPKVQSLAFVTNIGCHDSAAAGSIDTNCKLFQLDLSAFLAPERNSEIGIICKGQSFYTFTIGKALKKSRGRVMHNSPFMHRKWLDFHNLFSGYYKTALPAQKH